MGWFQKTEEEKARISKLKLERCVAFSDFLTENRINHRVLNGGYHIQVQQYHNFYPSKGSYYNPDTGKKFFYKKFKTIQEFYEFLQKNS